MARDLNKVMMTGYLGADPEMRFTPQGSPVTTFRVASGRSWKSADGTQHDDTEWFRVVAWEKLAEICNQYLTKGTRVYVEGRLQTRKYTDRDGQERYSTEVIATDMIILSSKRGEDGGDDGSYQGISGGNYGDEPMAKSAPVRGAASPTVPSRTPAPAPRNRPAPISTSGDDEFDAPPPPRPARPASGSPTPRKPAPAPLPDDDTDLPF